MADFKGYLLHWYACCQKTNGELWYYKTVSKFKLDRFLTFIHVWCHETFILVAFHFWQTNFASYKELTNSSVWGWFYFIWLTVLSKCKLISVFPAAETAAGDAVEMLWGSSAEWEAYSWSQGCWNGVTSVTVDMLVEYWVGLVDTDALLQLNRQHITLWCPLLPYGYSYEASCVRPG